MEAVADKVQKLLALAESSNPNEASAALVKAHALMVKYRLTAQDLEKPQHDYTTVVKPLGGVAGDEDPFVMEILNTHFGVKVFFNGSPTLVTGMVMAGRVSDVKVALQVYAILVRQFRASFNEHRELRSKAARKDFYLGARAALHARLTKATQEACADLALTVAPDQGLVRYVAEQFDVKPSDEGPTYVDAVDFEAGKQAGRRMRLDPAVEKGAPCPILEG